ncbi:unnamed protein product [Ascophyllum nodosum]
MWLVNYDEQTSTDKLALGYPLLGSSRHVRASQEGMLWLRKVIFKNVLTFNKTKNAVNFTV